MEFILFTVITGLIDCLNPSTIITQMLILVKSRSIKLSSYFTITTFLTYLLIGYLFSLGISALLADYFLGLKTAWNDVFIIVETVLLLACLLFLIIKLKKDKGKEKRKSVFLKPLPIIMLAVGSTISDFPTAFPYLAFIGKVKGFATLPALAYFVTYNLIYILPLVILLLVYSKKEEYLDAHFKKIELVINKIGNILLLAVLLLLIILFLLDIILYSTNADSVWQYLGVM